MADAGEVMAGPVGREIFGAAQIIFLVFVMGSHILTFSIMLNTLTDHATCSIIFGIVALVVCLVCTLPRTLLNVSYMAIVSFISIIAAVLITMIGVGIERPGDGRVEATVQTSLAKGFLAVTNIIFAYAGHVAFFSFISELKKPEEYPKALFLLQGVDTCMYVLVAVVVSFSSLPFPSLSRFPTRLHSPPASTPPPSPGAIGLESVVNVDPPQQIYRYAGTSVASPALGSTSETVRKIAYGLSIPTIVVAGVINGHVASKYIYVRLFRGTDRMSKRSWSSFGAWALIVLVLWTIAWVIAEAIPTFNDLLGLISALFASWFTYGLSGVFWLFMNRGRYGESGRKMALVAVNVGLVCVGLIIVSAVLFFSIIFRGKGKSGFFEASPFDRLNLWALLWFGEDVLCGLADSCGDCRWDWDSTHPAKRSETIPRAAAGVSPAPIIPRPRRRGERRQSFAGFGRCQKMHRRIGIPRRWLHV